MKSSLIWGGWFLLCAVILVGSGQSPSGSGNRVRPDTEVLPATLSSPTSSIDRLPDMRH